MCGDAANMAREVNAVLAKILAEGRGVSEAKGEEIVKSMRAANQYQVCYSGGLSLFYFWFLLQCRLTNNRVGGCLVVGKSIQGFRTSGSISEIGHVGWESAFGAIHGLLE